MDNSIPRRSIRLYNKFVHYSSIDNSEGIDIVEEIRQYFAVSIDRDQSHFAVGNCIPNRTHNKSVK